MTRRHASSASRNANVAPRFASLTLSNSCNASFSYGSHIREVVRGYEATKPHMRIQHPQPGITRYSVTTRPPRKNSPKTPVTGNASKRYTADRRTA